MVLSGALLARFSVPFVIAVLQLAGTPSKDKSLKEYENIISLQDSILENSDKILLENVGEGKEMFDYIVIGGGASGAVVVNRLVNDERKFSVLLLEAGGNPSPASDIPLAQKLVMESQMGLPYKSASQGRVCLRNGGVCSFLRGRALGGSSAINGMFYNRCNAKDYESWANFTGDASWGFDAVLHAYRRIESYHGVYEKAAGPNHGNSGEMWVGTKTFTPGVEEFFTAVKEKGFEIGDLNSFNFPAGFSKIDYNLKDGLRHGTYQAFLQPLEGKENLKTYKYSWATKIHFDDNKRAVGVSYTRHGIERYVEAKREIILSAGVIDSPKLLLLSGVGDKEELEKLNIPVTADNPAVGQNLQDHVGAPSYSFALNKKFGTADHLNPANVREYLANGTGPLLSFPVFDKLITPIAHGYLNSKSKNAKYSDPSWPDLHIYVYEQVLKLENDEEEETMRFDVELLRTDDRGSVRLASGKATDLPVIEPNLLKNDEDLERMIDGFEIMTEIFLETDKFKSLGAKWSKRADRVKECEGFPFPSREYWRCYIPYVSGTFYHPTSTCRMGRKSGEAVVDSKLRVFGVTGLRVIDSSVMPSAPSGNTNFPSIMIGEMGSRMLINDVDGCPKREVFEG